MTGHKYTFFLIVLLLIPFSRLYAGNFEPVLFEKHLKLIQTAHESDYSVQLENLFLKVKNQGASIEAVTVISLNAGISHVDFIVSCIKIYPTEKVVSSAIKSGGDVEEVIKTAILSGGDPVKIIAGAIEAGITPVDAETMVAVAMKLKREPGSSGPSKGESKEGLALTPGEELDSGGPAAPAPGVGVPVGGAGGGVASQS